MAIIIVFVKQNNSTTNLQVLTQKLPIKHQLS